jgi:UDP-3-O-[3-hydroxymyristoyl] glucosamine N-acyltransferase
MLINSDLSKPIYVVGKSPTANDIIHFVGLEHPDVKNITTEEYQTLPTGSQCMLGVLNMDFRLEFFNGANISQHTWPSYIHPNSVILQPSTIGTGTILWPYAYLGAGVTIGNFCTVAQFCSVGHGASVENNCVISPNTVIGGSAQLGSNIWIGQSSSVRDKITICDNIMFIMGSMVSKRVELPGKYYGNRKI